MSRDQSTDDVTPTAEHAGKEPSAFLMLVPARDGNKARAEEFPPDLTHGLMIRCDWDGDRNNRGTFQVKVKRGADVWANISPLDPGGKQVQLVSIDHEVTKVRVERGPNNSGVRLAVKLQPIRWKVVVPRHSHDMRVELGTHYEYDGGVPTDEDGWTHSSAGPNGQHVVVLNGIGGRDYEMWVKLWHPTDPNAKPQVQDPVVRTGGNIPMSGGGSSGTSGSRTH